MKAFRGILFGLALMTPACASFAGGAGSAGGEFLNVAASTRAAGMGEAFVGVSGDIGALHHNPAGIATMRDFSVHYLHAFWLESIGYDYLSAMTPLKEWGSVGASFTRVFLEAERVEVGLSGEPVPVGNFTASQMAAALSYGYSVGKSASVGGTLRFLSQNLDISRASAVAGDVGALYRTPLPSLTAGVQLTNLGSKLDSASLPVTMKVGGAYAMRPVKGLVSLAGKKGLWDKPLLTMDMHFRLAPQQARLINLRLGTEYTMTIDNWQSAALRAGYKFGEEGAGGMSGLTAGLGYGVSAARFVLKIDYAMMHFGDLGMTHRLAFTTSFLPMSQVSLSDQDKIPAAEREGQVYMTWPSSAEPNVSGYNVYMSEAKDGNYAKVNRGAPVRNTTLSVRGLTVGKTYHFFVTPVVGVEPAIEGRPFFETSAQAQPVP